MIFKRKLKDKMPTKMQAKDGLASLVNSLTNQRNALNTNVFVNERIDDNQLRIMYRLGLPNKIVRIKSAYAMGNTLEFKSKEDEEFYEERLDVLLKEATAFMIAFGRSIIFINELGGDVTQPLPADIDLSKVKLQLFSGDMVYVGQVSWDLNNPRYLKPMNYQVRGLSIHWTRVIDFTYVKPVERDAAVYKYGGMSEFDMIKPQLINDAIIERASATIVEKNSTLFYKIKDFNAKLQSKQEGDMVNFFNLLENNRSINGAGLIDSEDDVLSITQSLVDLKEVNENSLRRIGMVTCIPMPVLMGENAQGLNASGDNEMKVFNDCIRGLQDSFLKKPINQLMLLFNKGPVRFKENQWQTPEDSLAYESKAIDNAFKLFEMGQDGGAYLKDRNVVQESQIDEWFPGPDAIAAKAFPADDQGDDESAGEEKGPTPFPETDREDTGTEEFVQQREDPQTGLEAQSDAPPVFQETEDQDMSF